MWLHVGKNSNSLGLIVFEIWVPKVGCLVIFLYFSFRFIIFRANLREENKEMSAVNERKSSYMWQQLTSPPTLPATGGVVPSCVRWVPQVSVIIHPLKSCVIYPCLSVNISGTMWNFLVRFEAWCLWIMWLPAYNNIKVSSACFVHYMSA